MAKNRLEQLQAIGGPREGDDSKSEKARKEALQWVAAYKDMTEASKEEDKTDQSLVSYYNTLAAAGKLGSQAAEVSGIGQSLMARSLDFLFSKLKKGYENVVEIGRRRRKYALVGGGAAVGAGVGALLGTFVLPGLGTAVGGTVGAAITSAVGTLGGVVGTSIITAGVGAYAGNTIGKGLDDSETAYKFKTAIQKELQKKGNLTEAQTTYLYAYLRNRQEHVQDPEVTQAIKMLKNGVFKKGNMKGLNSLSFYLCSEFNALKGSDSQDEVLVRELLEALLKAQIEKKTKSHIQATLTGQIKPSKKQVSELSSDSDAVEKPGRSLVFDKPVSSKSSYSGLIVSGFADPILVQKSDAFKKELNDVFRDVLELSSIELEKLESDDKRKRTLHYQLDQTNNQRLDYTIKETQVEQGVKTKFLMASNQDSDEAADALVAATNVYLKNLPENVMPNLKVVAGGDEKIAVRLLASAYRLGLKPHLDEKEFPEPKIRKSIEEQAERLQLQPKPHVLKTHKPRGGVV